mmetsp:Transcript_23479/g.30506  ORF Transcript_23479/g.30506 Transcript_23479/m.30506 type:complete len:125 (+) Transcript_23479:219-593(+)
MIKEIRRIPRSVMMISCKNFMTVMMYFLIVIRNGKRKIVLQKLSIVTNKFISFYACFPGANWRFFSTGNDRRGSDGRLGIKHVSKAETDSEYLRPGLLLLGLSCISLLRLSLPNSSDDLNSSIL